MKSPSLNELMGFWPLCILLAFSLIVLFSIGPQRRDEARKYLQQRNENRMRISNMIMPLSALTGGNLEGMVTMNGGSNPLVEDLKKDFDIMQTTYAQLKNGIDDQKNRTDANAQMLLKVMGDTPEKTNDLTHANVNMDDPSKTRIPKIVM